MAYTGRCLCGQVRFRAQAALLLARACWCRDCRYWASGNAALNVVFGTETLTIEGDFAEFASQADSGNRMVRSFCPTCGTPLFSKAESRPHLTIVRAGALDDSELARPSMSIWTDSAPSWAHIDPDLPSTPGQPPAPGAKVD
jgi:hypothetical protein